MVAKGSGDEANASFSFLFYSNFNFLAYFLYITEAVERTRGKYRGVSASEYEQSMRGTNSFELHPMRIAKQ